MRPPGTPIEGVFTIGDLPSVVVPLTVVADDPDRVSHYIVAGTSYLRRELASGDPLPRVVRIDELRRMRTRLAWTEWRQHALVVTDPVAAHAIRLRWDPGTWEFRGWYVNLQRPLTRTPHGFQTEDHFLDILVRPDRTWAWKDEDELEQAVERERLTRAEAGRIRAAGAGVIEMIEAGRFPFDGSLERWRPNPAWDIPVLRPEWLEQA